MRATILLLLALVIAGCAGRQVTTSVDSEVAPVAGDLVDLEHLGRVYVPGHVTTEADIYRYSYVTDAGSPEVATARIAVPVDATAPYDVVAHLHGTIGFADHCAPSLMPGFGFESPLNPVPADMVAVGRVVVMPDFPGLGTPGRHRYIERDATGRSVWDALKAARILVERVDPGARLTDRLLLTGHSQGGHAVLSALATETPSDDFEVIGAVAFSPPGDAVEHARYVARGEARAAPLAWGLMSYARAFPDDVPRDWWFHEKVAEGLPDLMESRCAPTITVWLGADPHGIFTERAIDAFESGDVPQGLERVLARERLDDFETDAEILIVHGTADNLLPHELSRELARRLGERGNRVEWRAVDRAGHLSVPYRTRDEVNVWIEDRFGDG